MSERAMSPPADAPPPSSTVYESRLASVAKPRHAAEEPEGPEPEVYHGRHRLEDYRPEHITEDAWNEAEDEQRRIWVPLIAPKPEPVSEHLRDPTPEEVEEARGKLSPSHIGLLALNRAMTKPGFQAPWKRAEDGEGAEAETPSPPDALRPEDAATAESSKLPTEEQRRLKLDRGALGGAGAYWAIKKQNYLDWLHDKERDGERSNQRRGVVYVLGVAAVFGAGALAYYLASRGYGHHYPSDGNVNRPPPGGGGGVVPVPPPSPPELPPPATGGTGGETAGTVHSALRSGGNIWNSAVAYAEEHGNSLSEPEKRRIVGQILQTNHETWASAHRLPIGFKFIITPHEASELRNN